MLSRMNPGGGGGARQSNPPAVATNPGAPPSHRRDGDKSPSSNGGPKTLAGRIPAGTDEWPATRRASHRHAGAVDRGDPRAAANAAASPVAAKVLAAANPKLSYVDRVVLEILETERMYVRHLKTIVEDYLAVCSKKLTGDQVGTLFGNIKEIYKFNSELLRELEDCSNDPVAIAECFVEKSQGFEIYTQYCTNFPSSMELLTGSMRRKDAIYKLFRDIQAALKHNLPLGSFLLKPVQRILKYHLLLQEIAKRLDKTTDGYEVVEEALSAMHGVAWHINEMKRKHEHAIRIQELSGLIINKQDLSMLGDLALEGSFRLHRTRKERALFLFDTALVITKKRDDGRFLLKTEIKCRNLMILEQPRELEFCVWHYKKEKPRYTFQAKTQEEKSQWIHHIKRLILENHPSTVPDKAKSIILKMDPAYPSSIYSPSQNKRPDYREAKERKRRGQDGADPTQSKRTLQDPSQAAEARAGDALSPAPSVEMLDQQRGPGESPLSDRSMLTSSDTSLILDTSLTPQKAQRAAGKDPDVENGPSLSPARVRSVKRERPNIDSPMPFERQPSWKRVSRGSIGQKTKPTNFSDFPEDPPPGEPMDESASSSAENLSRYEVSIWELNKGAGGAGDGARSQPPSLCSESTLDDVASKSSDLDAPVIDTSGDELDDDTQTECSSGDSPLPSGRAGAGEARGSFADIMLEGGEGQVRTMLEKPARRGTQELERGASAARGRDGSADGEVTARNSPARPFGDGAPDGSSGEDTVCTSPVSVGSRPARSESARQEAVASGFFPIGSAGRDNSTDDEEFFSVLARTPSRRTSSRKSSFRVEPVAALSSSTEELPATVGSVGDNETDAQVRVKKIPSTVDLLSVNPSTEMSVDPPTPNKEEALTYDSEISDKGHSGSEKPLRASSFSKQDSFPFEERKMDCRLKDRVGSGTKKRDSLAAIPSGSVRDSVFAKGKPEACNIDDIPTQKSGSGSPNRRVSSPLAEKLSDSSSPRRKSEPPKEKSTGRQKFGDETGGSDAVGESHVQNKAKRTYGVTVFAGSVVKPAAANEPLHRSRDSLNSSTGASSDAAAASSSDERSSDREPPELPRGRVSPAASLGNREPGAAAAKHERFGSLAAPGDGARAQAAGPESEASAPPPRPAALPCHPRVTFSAMSHAVHFGESSDKSKSRVFNMARQYSMRIKKPKAEAEPAAGDPEQPQRSDVLEEKLRRLDSEENKHGPDKAVGGENAIYPKGQDSTVNKRSSVLSDSSITAAGERLGSDRSSTTSLPTSPGSVTSYSPRCLSPSYVPNRFFPEPSYSYPKGVNWPTVKELKNRYLQQFSSDGTGGGGGGARSKTLERHSDGRKHENRQMRRISSETGTASTGAGEPRSERKGREDMAFVIETSDEACGQTGDASGGAEIHLGKNFRYIPVVGGDDDDIPVFDSTMTLQDSPGVVMVNGTSCVGGRSSGRPAEPPAGPLRGVDDCEAAGASPAGGSARERKQITIKPAAERWGPREGPGQGPQAAAWQRDGNKRRGIAFGGSRALSAGEGVGIVRQLRDMFQRLSTSSNV